MHTCEKQVWYTFGKCGLQVAHHDVHLVSRIVHSLGSLPALQCLDTGRVWMPDSLMQPLQRLTQLQSLSIALKRVSHQQLASIAALTQLTALAVVQSQPVNHSTSDMVRPACYLRCLSAPRRRSERLAVLLISITRVSCTLLSATGSSARSGAFMGKLRVQVSLQGMLLSLRRLRLLQAECSTMLGSAACMRLFAHDSDGTPSIRGATCAGAVRGAAALAPLQSLKLNNCSLFSAAAAAMPAAQRNVHLTQLCLHAIPRSLLAHLAALLAQLPCLGAFSVDFNTMFVPNEAPFLAALKRLAGLRALQLKRAAFERADAFDLSALTQLEDVDVYIPRLSDGVVLAESLAGALLRAATIVAADSVAAGSGGSARSASRIHPAAGFVMTGQCLQALRTLCMLHAWPGAPSRPSMPTVSARFRVRAPALPACGWRKRQLCRGDGKDCTAGRAARSERGILPAAAGSPPGHDFAGSHKPAGVDPLLQTTPARAL